MEITPAWVHEHLPKRPLDANKGSFGRVLVIGGCELYRGAPVLAGRAAYRVGAGIVTLCVHPAVDMTAAAWLPEATHIPFSSDAATACEGITSVVIGPGMGQSTEAWDWLARYLQRPQPCPHVLDADALNLLAQHKALDLIPETAVLTPHPGEMSRLTGRAVADIQANRDEIARQYAQEWGCVVVLKGANTVIASPNDDTILNSSNPALAVAGTGDVLAGAIGGLLAQGLSAFDAASCGAWLHAEAGSLWSKQNGDRGLLAHELADMIVSVNFG